MQRITGNMAILPLLRRLLIAILIILSILLFTRQALITYHDAIYFGGTDLRARIIGSRLMEAGLDPYFTKWRPGMGEYLCDPNDTYGRPVNGITVTPLLLWLQQPFARLPYPTLRVSWWALQQSLFLFTTLLCAWFYRRSTVAVVSIVFVATALANHPFWLMHCERGQIYILYAAWLAVLFAIGRRSGNKAILAAGAWLALGVLLRPTLAVFALPLLLTIPFRQKIILSAAGSFFTLLLLWLSGTWQYWPIYFKAMEIYINNEIGGLRFVPTAAPQRPVSIEGATNITRVRTDLHFNYFYSLNILLGDKGFWPPRKFFPIALLLAEAFWVGTVYWTTRFRLTPVQQLMLGALLYFTAEVCQPYRAPYNLAVWLPTVLVAVGFIMQSLSVRRPLAITP